MSMLLTLIDRAIDEEVLSLTRQEMSRAAEIFIAETFARTHYSQILDKNITKGLVSSQQFLAWTNDLIRKGKGIVRPGLLWHYARDCPDHFPDGHWMPFFLPAAMAYVREKTQDKEYVKDARVRASFAASFADPLWVRSASGLFGFKLLERLYEEGRLLTKPGREIVEGVIKVRELEKSFARILGRAKKDGHPISDEDFQKLHRLVHETAPASVFTGILRRIETESGYEYMAYRRCKASLERLLAKVAEEAGMLLPRPVMEHSRQLSLPVEEQPVPAGVLPV